MSTKAYRERLLKQEAMNVRLDMSTPEMTGTREKMDKLRCETCGAKAAYALCPYMLSRNRHWKLLCCKCPGKIVWFEIEDEK